MNTINFLPSEFKNKGIFKKDSKLKATVLVVFMGMLALSLIQTSVNIQGGNRIASQAAASEVVPNNVSKIVYGEDFGNEAEIKAMLEKQVKLVASRKAFLPSMEVVKKHEKEIRRVANAKGVPENVALGISFLENGGSESATSSAGARGIYQLMPGTARDQGLVVNGSRDDRLDTSKSIEAGLTYLKGNYNILGDWGLTTWSYHAGAGNVCKAVKIYAQAEYGVALQGCNSAIGEFIRAKGITVNDVLSHRSVQSQLTSLLKDDSAGYPYKVMATSHLFELDAKLGRSEFLQRVTLLNTGGMALNEFFRS